MVGLGVGGEFGVIGIFVAVEPETVFAEEFGGDFVRAGIAGEFYEAAEIEVVVAGGEGAAAFFDLEGFEVVGDEVGYVHVYIIYGCGMISIIIYGGKNEQG